MKQSSDETTKELPSAVDDAVSVISESKRKEAFVRKNAPVEKILPERIKNFRYCDSHFGGIY